MSTFVNADCGQVLGIVDGRDSAAVGGWLSERSPAWRDRIEVVAIDPSAAFKRAITEQLPNAKMSVDPFHLVQLANLMVTRVRQRLIREREQRRGRTIDPAWAHRTLLLRGYDTLSERRQDRLAWVFATDDPTDELSAAWGVKEQLHHLLASANVETARTGKMILGCYVLAADMEETWPAMPARRRRPCGAEPRPSARASRRGSVGRRCGLWRTAAGSRSSRTSSIVPVAGSWESTYSYQQSPS